MQNRLFPITLAMLALLCTVMVAPAFAQDDPTTPIEPAPVTGPEDIARAYMEAWKAGDAEGAVKLIHPDGREMAEFAMSLAFAMVELKSYEIGDAEMDGEKAATVPILSRGSMFGFDYTAVEVFKLSTHEAKWYMHLNEPEDEGEQELGPDGEPLDETDLTKADRERMGTPEGTTELFFELWAAYDGHKATNLYTGSGITHGNELCELFFFFRTLSVAKIAAEVDEDAGTATVTVVFDEVEIVEEILAFETIELTLRDGVWLFVGGAGVRDGEIEIDTTGQDTARGALEKLLTAWQKKDQSGFLSVIHPDHRAETEGDLEMMFGMLTIKSFEITSIEIDEDAGAASASVTVTMVVFGDEQESDNPMELVLLDGVWYVVPN